MANDQNNISPSFNKKCMSGISKPFRVVSHWYCGPNDTRAGKTARAVFNLSTLLMVTSGVLLYQHHQHYVLKDDIDGSLLATGGVITFAFGMVGYIATFFIGTMNNEFYNTSNASYNTVVINIEQPAEQEHNNHNQLHPYKETVV